MEDISHIDNIIYRQNGVYKQKKTRGAAPCEGVAPFWDVSPDHQQNRPVVVQLVNKKGSHDFFMISLVIGLREIYNTRNIKKPYFSIFVP